jgi:hypothetical protein
LSDVSFLNATFWSDADMMEKLRESGGLTMHGHDPRQPRRPGRPPKHSHDTPVRAEQTTFFAPIRPCSPSDLGSSEVQRQTDLILVGFCPKTTPPSSIIKCPVDLPPSPAFDDAVSYIEESLEHMLDGNFSAVSATNLYQLASLLQPPQCQSVHGLLSGRIAEFARSIRTRILRLGDVRQVGDLWQSTRAKIDLLSMSLSPICVRRLPDLSDIFRDEFSAALRDNRELFRGAVAQILDSYSWARLEEHVIDLLPVFYFLRDSGLFEEVVVPMFTRAIVDYVAPILDESFRKPLRDYLTDAVNIQKQEQQLSAPLFTDSAR